MMPIAAFYIFTFFILAIAVAAVVACWHDFERAKRELLSEQQLQLSEGNNQLARDYLEWQRRLYAAMDRPKRDMPPPGRPDYFP